MVQLSAKLFYELSRHSTWGDQWWGASVSKQLMNALGQNPSEFKNVVRARSALADLGDLVSKGYVSDKHTDGSLSIWICLKREQTYNLLREYGKARELRKVRATAHGWFWSLPEGDLPKAVKFWRRFGQLEPPVVFRLSGVGDEYKPLDLGDFWNKQRRFRAVTKVWLSLEDIPGLRRSWVEFKKQLEAIDAAEDFPFGSLIFRGGTLPTEIDSPLLAQLRDADQRSFEEWLNQMDDLALRGQSISLIECELNAQLGALSVWRYMYGAEKPGFKLAPIPRTLWSALWYLFLLDANVGTGLRICPHCRELFYPPRKNSQYCTTELQSHYAQIRWWEKNKEQELAKRRASREKLRTGNRGGK